MVEKFDALSESEKREILNAKLENFKKEVEETNKSLDKPMSPFAFNLAVCEKVSPLSFSNQFDTHH